MKEELETRRQQMKYYFCAVIGVLSLHITEIYPTVTRNRGNSAFCTVIGFTVTTGEYEFVGNVLQGIGKCVFSR